MQSTIKLTAAQARELEHKLLILTEEEDLRDSYGITEGQAIELYESVPASGEFTFDRHFADMLAQELENSVGIAKSNGDTGLARTLQTLISKIENS